MSIFLDNFEPDPLNSKKQINKPKLAYGAVIGTGYSQEQKCNIVLMNTGMIYTRSDSYTDDSPYGWNELYKELIFVKPLNPNDKQLDYESFSISNNYFRAIHFLNIKQTCENREYLEFKSNSAKLNFELSKDHYITDRFMLYKKYGQSDFLKSIIKSVITK